MTAADQLLQRLLEELLETGRSVEAVCAAHPQLIPEVRRRLARVRGVQEQMDVLFPPAGPVPGNSSDADAPRPPGPG